MSKAETVAFEYAKENGTLGLDYNQIYDAVKHGYYQAEKDLELSCNDIKNILNIYDEVIGTDFCEDIYGEVLKRFKERK